MQPYANNSGKSNVVAYYIGDDFIVVQFPHNSFYKYSYASAGQAAVETMKKYAKNGFGLGTFISTKATQPPYDSKASSLRALI